MKRLAAVALVGAALLAGPATAQSPDDAKSPDRALKALLLAAKADASRIRGLPFLCDVPVRRITRDEFIEITLRDIHRIFGEGERLDGMEQLLHLLHVLPADTGLMDLVKRFFPATVAAKYDPVTKEVLFLRGFRSRSIMVHELTHALEDQHYNLGLLLENGEMTFDRLLALGALAEGDAEDVQQNFDTGGVVSLTPLAAIRSLGEKQVDAYLSRMKDFPRAIARPFIFQYLSGMLFVETIKRSRGGFRGLDAVYRDPPVTTEQILHPERYLDRDRPTRITPAPPPGDYRILVSNVLGELGTGIVLAEHLGKAYDPAAAEGWDGDRIELLAPPEGPPLLRWYTTWDTEADAREFREAAEAMFAARRPGAALTGGEELRIQKDGDRVHAIRSSGRDVLVVEGLPKEGFASVLSAISGAKKSELRELTTTFGGEK